MMEQLPNRDEDFDSLLEAIDFMTEGDEEISLQCENIGKSFYMLFII